MLNGLDTLLPDPKLRDQRGRYVEFTKTEVNLQKQMKMISLL